MKKRLLIIVLFNILSLALFFSWFFPVNHGFWFPIDSAIFYFFNQGLVKSRFYLWLVALTNHRFFDGFLLLVMFYLMFWHWRKFNNADRLDVIFIFLSMLLTAIILNQISKLLIPVKRSSPTLFFSNIYRINNLVSISVKDASKDSFPGDHGIMLFIFSAFTFRYFGKGAFFTSLVICIFSFPRIMIGAHWFSDIFVGSLTVVFIGLPWCLMTPLNDYLIMFMDYYISKKIRYFRK